MGRCLGGGGVDGLLKVLGVMGMGGGKVIGDSGEGKIVRREMGRFWVMVVVVMDGDGGVEGLLKVLGVMGMGVGDVTGER